MVLESAKNGILITVLACLATVLVLVLVKIATSMKRLGHFDVVMKRIGLLDPHELRISLEFENESKRDREFSDLSLCYMKEKSLCLVSKMAFEPIPRGLDSSFVQAKDGGYSFLVEKGKSQSVVVTYVLPNSFVLPQGARFCLSCQDEKGRMLCAEIDLSGQEAKLLSFKRYKKKA